MLKNIKKEHINILHLLVVAPLLIYGGWKGNELAGGDEKTKWVYRVLLAAGVLVAVVHGAAVWKKYGGKLGMKGSDKGVEPETDDDSDE